MGQKGKSSARGKAATLRDARREGSRVAARGARARELRIIGGKWKSLRLRFPQGGEIRPTPDRVRETLFNWLAPQVRGARCLDLFAGSGALGLEALSRGAGEVIFVERDPKAARALAELLLRWEATGGHVERADARSFLAARGDRGPFDMVFLDPPFGKELLGPVAQLLEAEGWLMPAALIYVESAAREPLPALPAAWRPYRSGRAGEVGYHLFARGPSGASMA